MGPGLLQHGVYDLRALTPSPHSIGPRAGLGHHGHQLVGGQDLLVGEWGVGLGLSPQPRCQVIAAVLAQHPHQPRVRVPVPGHQQVRGEDGLPAR